MKKKAHNLTKVVYCASYCLYGFSLYDKSWHKQRVDNTLAMFEKTKTLKQHNLNVLPASPSLTSWQPSRDWRDEVITRVFVVWQHHAEDIHPMTENMFKAFTRTFPHTRTHDSKWGDLPIFKRWDLSPLQTECSYCFKERQKIKPLYCTSAASSQLIANRDILAIKKWYMRTHNPPRLL